MSGLARQLGSGLAFCTYILDEPTIGLHPYNTSLLIHSLKKLQKKDNSLILIEHDTNILQEADIIYDFGPGAGDDGGKITAIGTIEELKKNPQSLTGLYLSGKKQMPLPQTRRQGKSYLTIKNAKIHNLQNITTKIYFSCITCVTGISGCGKSSLIHDILQKQLENFYRTKQKPSNIENYENIENIISLDQSVLGQTARSDVSTYSEILPLIRSFLASLPKAKAKGLMPRHFSYNHKKGMCHNCQGLGYKIIDLQYLPSIKITCDSCQGYKLNPLSLSITYKNMHQGQILELSIEQALTFFAAHPRIVKRLQTLISVGLGYVKLGQDIQTLSLGEGQRLRLAKELAKKKQTHTLYIFDEPTIGLHNDDIAKLIPIFHRLADKKNTVIIIEHNLDIIANADYIIDLGPYGGDQGGKIMFSGKWELLHKNKSSLTAQFLQKHLQKK